MVECVMITFECFKHRNALLFFRYNSVLKPCETGVGHEYKGVIHQLVDDMVDTERPELVDLRHRNEGIKDLLRSGLK